MFQLQLDGPETKLFMHLHEHDYSMLFHFLILPLTLFTCSNFKYYPRPSQKI